MTEVDLKLSDYHELYALHRAILEAKFSLAPRDSEVRGSAFVASVANKVMDALIQMERELGREDHARSWEMKRQMNPDTFPDLWMAALKGIEGSREWLSWTREQKKGFAEILLSPFIASDDILSRFIDEADQVAQP